MNYYNKSCVEAPSDKAQYLNNLINLVEGDLSVLTQPKSYSSKEVNIDIEIGHLRELKQKLIIASSLEGIHASHP